MSHSLGVRTLLLSSALFSPSPYLQECRWDRISLLSSTYATFDAGVVFRAECRWVRVSLRVR